MKCFKPLKAYRLQKIGEDPQIVWKDQRVSETTKVDPIEIRCGNCIGCRLTKARHWAVRMTHESTMHKENSFITLTYRDKDLPENAGLDVRDWQLFLKKLRKELEPKKIRFYMCGEYGHSETEVNNLGRPHFHAIIFGHNFHDDRVEKRAKPHKAYESPTLTRIWGKGIAELSDMTLETAAYCAQYTVKKINGSMAKDHYIRVDKNTGDYVRIRPEFSTMSRRPGIGRDWYDKYKGDLDKGFVTVNGRKEQIPKFYERIMTEDRAWELEQIREKRLMSLKKQDQWNLEREFENYEKRTRSINR